MRADALPAGLANSFTATPATAAELADVHALLVAETTAVVGHCHDTEEDVRSWLEPPPGASTRQLLVRSRATGALQQWWGGTRAPGDPRFEAWVHTHPDVSTAYGDELTRAAWQLLTSWVRDVTGPDRADDVLVHSGCVAGDESALRRLLEAGFVHERTFWEMAGTVPGEPPPAAGVPGLTIRPAGSDPETVHRIAMEAFAEHWGFEPTTFDDWLPFEQAAAGYDPDLWVLAEIDSDPVAVLMLSRRSAAEHGLYVAELGTLQAYRRRGIASALLRHAFDVASAESYREVILHVDSENTDGAPAIYQRAGLQVRDAFNACVLRLAPG